jgi:fluoroacetyl-CoA thioesterase
VGEYAALNVAGGGAAHSNGRPDTASPQKFLETKEAMDTLKIGMKDTLEWEVTERLTTTRGEFKVFSTPSMCLLAEMASHKLAAPHLKAGQGQVGLTITIRHMAPTPLGKMVRAETELVEIDRRRLKFRVQIFDDVEQVGDVTHERFVIDVDKYTERLRKKING